MTSRQLVVFMRATLLPPLVMLVARADASSHTQVRELAQRVDSHMAMLRSAGHSETNDPDALGEALADLLRRPSDVQRNETSGAAAWPLTFDDALTAFEAGSHPLLSPAGDAVLEAALSSQAASVGPGGSAVPADARDAVLDEILLGLEGELQRERRMRRRAQAARKRAERRVRLLERELGSKTGKRGQRPGGKDVRARRSLPGETGA